MNIDGLILIIITAIISIAIIICHHGIKKITNCYFFGAAIGIFFLVGLIIFKFAQGWINYSTATITNPHSYSESYIISRAFMLDVCPFAAFSLCVSLIADPSRKISRALSPIALIGGTITIGSLCFDSDINARLTAQFIFIGDDLNPCYFIMHFIQIVIPVGIMVNTPRNGGKGTLVTLIITISYYSYVAIVMATTGCSWNVSGLSINDGTMGEYRHVSEILKIPPNICQIIGIPILALVGCGIIVLKDYVFDKKGFRYGNSYSNKGYLGYNYNKFVKQSIL